MFQKRKSPEKPNSVIKKQKLSDDGMKSKCLDGIFRHKKTAPTSDATKIKSKPEEKPNWKAKDKLPVKKQSLTKTVSSKSSSSSSDTDDSDKVIYQNQKVGIAALSRRCAYLVFCFLQT